MIGAKTNPFSRRFELKISGELIAVEPRSIVPGRERWHVSILEGRPELALRVQESVQAYPGVLTVRINTLLGSILLEYDTKVVDSGVTILSRSALGAVTTALAKPGSARLAVKIPDLSAGVTVAIGVGWALTILVLPLPIWFGGAVFLTSAFLLRHFWHKSARARARQSGGVAKKHPLVRFFELDPALRKKVWFAAGCSVLNKICNIAPAFIVGHALTILTSGPIGALAAIGIASTAGQLMFLTGLGVLLWTLESWLEFKAGVSWREIAQVVQHGLRMRGYRHVQELEFKILADERLGNLAGILNEEVNDIKWFLDTGAHDLLQLAADLIIIGPLLFVVAPSAAWLAVIPIPLLIWFSFRYVDRTSPLYGHVRKLAGAVASQIATNLQGMTVIRSFTTEEYEVSRIRRLSLAYKQANQVTDILAAKLPPSIRMSMLIAWAGTILVGGLQVSRGTIDAGVFATLIQLAQRFLWPILILGKTVDDYQHAMASAERVFDLIDIPAPPPQLSIALSPRHIAGALLFDKVGFAYPGRPPVIEDLSLRIQAGKTTAIVGTTGSGKTTLVNLLLRFYEVDSGRILLDGADIRDFDVHDLRRNIGLISQEVFLFDGTIRENVTYGRFDASMDTVIAACQTAEIHSFIEQLPQGYETHVGERGIKLSGGQRQRICLARAIVKDAPVLVLDEATSSIDVETEAAIQRALRRVCIGRTTLMVAHRLSTVRQAHLIYVLNEQGQIAEQGTHAQLVKAHGIYASMWAVQTGALRRGSRLIE